MTYYELVDAVRAAYAKADASEIKEHIAFQFNIEGEGEGAFYLEIADGKINIEPYEYYDRDVIFTTKAETLLKIGTGKLDPVLAYTIGKLKVEGSIEKALVLKKITPKSVDAEAIQKEVFAGAGQAPEESEPEQEGMPQISVEENEEADEEETDEEEADEEETEDEEELEETEDEAETKDAARKEKSEAVKNPAAKAAQAREAGADFAKKRQNRKIKKKRR